MKKILLVTEYLNPPYDEGIKKTAFNLYVNLKERYQLKVISRVSFEDENICIINTNALFISSRMKNQIRAFKPDVIIYFPFSSSTFASYLRLRILTFYAKDASVVFLALQPKKLKAWQEYLVRMNRPKYALTPSPSLKLLWDKMGVKNDLLPLLTDLNTFKALSKNTSKQELRKKYNLPLDSFIISHMGHLNEGRNLQSLLPLQRAGYQVLVIGSSSTPKDAIGPTSLKDGLINEGVIVLDGYIEHIEEIYQLSDLYIFPVIAKNCSIGMPLSIMEARACATPVITTDFGSLNYYLEDDYNGIFYSEPPGFLEEVQKIEKLLHSDFSKTKVESINKEFYSIIHSTIAN